MLRCPRARLVFTYPRVLCRTVQHSAPMALTGIFDSPVVNVLLANLSLANAPLTDVLLAVAALANLPLFDLPPGSG